MKSFIQHHLYPFFLGACVGILLSSTYLFYNYRGPVWVIPLAHETDRKVTTFRGKAHVMLEFPTITENVIQTAHK